MTQFYTFLRHPIKDVVTLLLAFLIWPSFTYAQKYNFRVFSLEEGLPQASVLALFSDDRGVIHIGTQGGYSVFDGKRFNTLNQKDGLNNNHITTIHQMDAQRFWLGHRYEAPSLVTEAGVFPIQSPLADSIRSVTHTITTIGETVWFGTQKDGLFTYDVETHHLSRVEMPFPSDELSIHKLIANHQQHLYMASSKGLFIRLGQEFKLVDLSSAELTSNYILSMHYDFDGSLIIMTPQEIVRLYVNQDTLISSKKLYVRSKNETESWSNFLVTRKQHLWIATDGGALQIINGKRKMFSSNNGLGSNHVSSILEDREGNIWMGLFGQGLYQYLGSDFKQIDASVGLIGNTVQAITIHQNEVWVGTEEGLSRLIYEDDNLNVLREIESFTTADGLLDNDIFSLVTGADGHIWISSMNGVARFDRIKNRIIAYPSDRFGLPDFLITMDMDKQGRLWLGSLRSGCVRVTLDSQLNFQIIDEFKAKNGLNSNQIWKIFCDRQGRVWIGTNDHGLFLYENDVLVSVPNLATSRPASITEDRDGHIWIGSIGDGVFRYDGTSFTNYTSADGISSDNPYFVAGDAIGNIWIGTNKGVDRFDIQSGDITTFGKNEGFKGVETNQNAFYRDKNGNMWFGTIQGVVHCYPNEIHSSDIPPIVYLSGIRVYLIPRKIESEMVLTYNENYVTFDFSGVHYTSPDDVLFSFMLEGFNDQWSPLSAENAATFSNLPPGNYHFKVKAQNRDGVWSDEATLSFSVTPPFWLTWWFQSLVVLLVLVLIFFVFEIRTQSLVRQRKQLKEMVELRTHELMVEKLKVDEFNDKLTEQNVLLESKNNDITASIRYAERIQNGMLPGEAEIASILPENVLYFKPRDIVSGDFYWCKSINGVQLFAAIDCTGHGVPGAFMSLIGNDLLNQAVGDVRLTKTGEILLQMHQGLRNYFAKEGIDDGMDMALCALLPNGQLQFSGAKRPLFVVRKNEVIAIKGDRFSIGEPTNNVSFQTEVVDLVPGDMIYIFSDGFPDQFGGDPKNGGKKFMIRRFRELLVSIACLPCDQQYNALNTTLNAWKGELEQVDDVLVWGVRYSI
jgi:ligand-binding sensor domain-containing protein/serine phosphatase RsbU (regulator of sigma subunit)